MLTIFLDMRTEIFGFTNDAVVEKLVEMCQKLMFHDSIPDFFSFSYYGKHGMHDGWEVYHHTVLFYSWICDLNIVDTTLQENMQELAFLMLRGGLRISTANMLSVQHTPLL